MAKAIPVKGTQFFVQDGWNAEQAISAVTATNPGTFTSSALSASVGDVVEITGTPGFNGTYVVTEVQTSTYTLAGADWTGLTIPGSYTNCKAKKGKWNSKFCDIKSFSRTGGTTDQTDITDVCSDGREFEPGLYDGGTLSLTFNYYPDDVIQKALSTYEDTGAKFWAKWAFPRGNTALLHYVSIQTGANVDGSVGGTYESGVTLKISGRPVLVATA